MWVKIQCVGEKLGEHESKWNDVSLGDKRECRQPAKQSGQSGHMVPITSDWHQNLRTQRHCSSDRLAVLLIDSYPSPLPGPALFFALVLLLTPVRPSPVFSILSPSLRAFRPAN